jgi:ubiquitin carboxyl-terminal hydrolase 9/13
MNSSIATNPYAPSPYSLNGAIASTSIIAQNALKDPNAPPPIPSLPVDYSRNEEYGMRESLFTCLKDLFERIVGENGKSGVIAPMKLVEVLKRENGNSFKYTDVELFQGNTHQDAHEFLNYLLNDVVESVDRYERGRAPSSNGTSPSLSNSRWVHELFEGILTSETKCLTCENFTTRDEVFLDLSIDIEQNSSVSACLRQFSASEMLCERNKFHCDICGGLQEAEKRYFLCGRFNIRMKIQKSPKILALHLKRFKYTEDMQRNLKLFHRVVYPPTLRLFNTTDDAADPDKMYELYAVVVHIGGGPYHGHYVTVVKNDDTGKWMLIDDEAVEAVDDGFVGRFYGDRPGMASAYVLFYQQVDSKPNEPKDNETTFINGKVNTTEISSLANGIAKVDLSEKYVPVNGHSAHNSVESLSRVPSSPVVSRTPTRVPPLATVEEKAIVQTTPPPPPPAQIITPSKSSPPERTPTKKELKDAAKREKEERKEREKREKEAKQRDGKTLGRSGLGTIKRWGKDRDKTT